MKNNINKLFLFCSFLVVSLSLNVYDAQSKCATINGILETIEICDMNGAETANMTIGEARGGAMICADLGDTEAATRSMALKCNDDCTINSSMCSGGFGSPKQPKNVVEDIGDAVINTTNWILGFMTSLAVLALIYGGVQYLTSAGNEQQTEVGKKNIKFAIIGLVIAGIAYAIVNVIVATILV